MEWAWRVFAIGILFTLLGGAVYLLLTQNRPDSPTPLPPSTSTPTDEPPKQEVAAPTRFHAQMIDGVSKVYRWSAELPAGWHAEWVPETEAINLYDPTLGGESNLENSQVFIRSFEASDFLTLLTVQIYHREQLEVDGHPAVRYVIEKRPEIPDFQGQPRWRNTRHTVTDVRVSDEAPSDFYVIAQHPELSDETYQQFLATFHVVDESIPVEPAEPVAAFQDRVTKKPFGLRVTPRNSPVQPERFSGFHTGIDIEYSDTPDEVDVYAIENGTVRLARTVDGYGGVVVIEHELDGTRYQVIYGHLDPSTLPKLGQAVARGEVIGRLGDGGTAETDGERKHLHFGVYSGTDANIRGYVAREADLKRWIDPLTLYH